MRERAERSSRPDAGGLARDPFAAGGVPDLPYPTMPPSTSVSSSESRRKKRAVPNARQRKRRKACITFASFLLFLAALVALT